MEKGKARQNRDVAEEELKQVCLNRIYDYLVDDSTPGSVAREANTALSNITRMKATEQVKDSVQWQIARDLAENKGELKKYVAATMPHLNPVARLPKA